MIVPKFICSFRHVKFVIKQFGPRCSFETRFEEPLKDSTAAWEPVGVYHDERCVWVDVNRSIITSQQLEASMTVAASTRWLDRLGAWSSDDTWVRKTVKGQGQGW